MLRNNLPAPSFDLPDEMETVRSLDSLRDSRSLLILFSRFADCPTSQRDLLAYANVYDRLRSLNADMVAVTVESPPAHRELCSRLGLPFSLLSDEDFAVSERYGIYRSDEIDEGPQPHGEPAVFVLDVDGRIAYSQVQSGPKGLANPAEIALVFAYMDEQGGRYW